jgi:hypothetical protein
MHLSIPFAAQNGAGAKLDALLSRCNGTLTGLLGHVEPLKKLRALSAEPMHEFKLPKTSDVLRASISARELISAAASFSREPIVGTSCHLDVDLNLVQGSQSRYRTCLCIQIPCYQGNYQGIPPFPEAPWVTPMPKPISWSVQPSPHWDVSHLKSSRAF